MVDNFTFGRVFVIVMTLTAGCVLLMWLGELITQRGIGNGISLMIFASIASRIPNGIQAWWTNPDKIFMVMMPFLALAVIARSCSCRRASAASRSSTRSAWWAAGWPAAARPTCRCA